MGVIGLGTGTLARMAARATTSASTRSTRWCCGSPAPSSTYLNDCKAKVDVSMGDARLSLEKETGEHFFDVLAVDAFSSDSIPVHLLTLEAMELYFRQLKPDGILAVHISNRYLDLQPVLEGETAPPGSCPR